MAVQKNFVIRNGIEVNENLFVADSATNRVGIATTIPNYTFEVRGGIGVTNFNSSGVSTFNDLKINGRITAGSSLGAVGQYLVSTGTGVGWTSPGTILNVRTVDAQTANPGDITFNTPYTVDLLDVFINGVKLSGDEFTAIDSATVTLDDPCFGGETVEFVSYSPFAPGVGTTSLQGITILEEGSVVGSSLQVTSINFVGAAVTAVGTGVGVTVYISDATGSGIATYANTAGISTYASSAGIATYADTAGISTYAVSAGVATDVIGGIASVTSVTAGIVTATSGFISIGNTTPVTIELVGNQLTFNAVGIGSTTFTLF